jgi:hypothetical protein
MKPRRPMYPQALAVLYTVLFWVVAAAIACALTDVVFR